MGVTDSRVQQVTPSRPLLNRHLARVIDPRSPSVGIPRTPIEVAGSPQCSPVVTQEEEVTEAAGGDDPRSPTQGIVRTPLRPSLQTSLNLLAKQLSEVFVTEDPGIVDGSKEAPVEILEERPEDSILAPAEEVDKEVEFAEEALTSLVEPTSLAEPTPPSVQPQRPRGKSPRAAGAKNIRQRPRKALVSSAHGRSPLKVLQEDNSPNTAMQNRQVKIIPFQSEPPPSLRNLKMSNCSWEISQNKENAQYTQSDG